MPGEPPMAARPNALRRLARLLRPNALRRPSDRVELALVALLLTAFLATVIVAPFLGARIDQSQSAAAQHLHPAVAVLSDGGPYGNGLAGNGWAIARWRAPDGQQRIGTLTTLTAPDIWNASPGARVPVWLNSSGVPAIPPPGPGTTLFTTVSIVMLAGITLMICYWLCRVVLDRRRLAAWESAWARIGPRWTTRR
jgi:hypothetical protein